ncbi:hypothetical protein BDY21DRAFT_374391 [Lineolata rhizophorae]|uniref:AMP-dependent synthetase/ligase domain-containing protein n=1 Tax=Lineolata rhizophorae TaxID=578093 RepID=A0A6A6NQT4_9PEZI|nr:hypothetical protein BDY21DRAFT_374391 [Lineolata rhizophorae]
MRIDLVNTTPDGTVPETDILSYIFDSTADADSKIYIDIDNNELEERAFLTKPTLRTLVSVYAYCLRSKFGIGANGPNKDIVMLLLSGRIAAPAVFYAVIAAGGVACLGHPQWTNAVIADRMEHCGARLLICTEDLRVQVRRTLRMMEMRGQKKDGKLGQTLELCVHGPSVVRKYFNDDSANKASFQGEWFRTGIRAVQAGDGQYFFTKWDPEYRNLEHYQWLGDHEFDYKS